MDGGLAGLEVSEALVNLVPVQDVPPGGEIFGAAIVVFQVVGVLPDIVSEDGIESLRNGVVLVRRGHDLHFSIGFACQPDPAAAELFRASIVELGFEIVEVAKGFLDDLSDLTCGIASAFGLHDLPEHAVVDVASAIVTDGGADVIGDGVEVADEFVGGFIGKIRVLLEGGVEILHIGAVVHVVMQSHGLLIDGRFESVVTIR